MNIRTLLARAKRKLLQKPWLKDQRFPGYWCDTVLGGKAAFVVQIGSNDGKTGDPLHQLFQRHLQWKGLFVEPVPYLFERLKQNYPDANRFRFENAAITDQSAEKLTFYWVDPKAKNTLPDLPYWYDQLGSFNRNRILEELDGKLEPFILSKELDCINMATLLERNKVTQIDLLHIDTEGHDWAILSQLDLQKVSPTFILYEFNHLSEKEVTASLAFLKRDFVVFNVGIDMLAVNRTVGTEKLAEMRKHMTEAV